MRRDQFTMAVRDGDDPPTLDITHDGPADELANRLTDDGEPLAPEEIDAAFRLFGPLDDATGETGTDRDGQGVFSLTHRVTGAYLLEVNADVSEIFRLVARARERDDGTSYRLQMGSTDSDDVTVYRMSALFVYDGEGELLRQHSLIPSGVEL